MKTKNYSDKDYQEAIKFVLNYPVDRDIPLTYSYKEDKDIFKVVIMDGGWVNFKLTGKTVRLALAYEGIKQWVPRR